MIRYIVLMMMINTWQDNGLAIHADIIMYLFIAL